MKICLSLNSCTYERSLSQLYSQMDELKREVQHRGAEVELTRQELQTTIDLKVCILSLLHATRKSHFILKLKFFSIILITAFFFLLSILFFLLFLFFVFFTLLASS